MSWSARERDKDEGGGQKPLVPVNKNLSNVTKEHGGVGGGGGGGGGGGAGTHPSVSNDWRTPTHTSDSHGYC